MTNDRNCAEVPRHTPSEIKSCNFYGAIDECHACNINSYNRNGICRPSKQKVEDCTLMDAREKCRICDLKIPSYNQTYCQELSIDDFDNCLLLRHPLSCKQCQPGYQSDKNYFLSFINEPSVHKNFFNKVGFWRFNLFDIGKQGFCI